MHIKKLYEIIGTTQLTKKVPDGPTLEEMGITKKKIEAIDKWARKMTTYGILARYIPELRKVNPNLTAIAIGDLHQNKIVVGDGAEVVASPQSVAKPFLYLYALSKGASPESLTGIEATALPFSSDRILQPELDVHRAQHPLDNAGGISSAGKISDFEDFLKFMRTLTENPKLKVHEEIFKSEMNTNTTNRAITQRLVGEKVFKSLEDGKRALSNYTKACAIRATITETLHACIVLASGGIDIFNNNKRLVDRDYTVRVMAAMNSFGMYEKTGETTLLVAGARANTGKSGVGGFIVNINPGVGAFVTYSPLLDSAGNSIYGSIAMIPLNNLLAVSGAMRLDFDETERSLKAFQEEDSREVHEEIIRIAQRGEKPSVYRYDSKMLKKLKKKHVKKAAIVDKLLKLKK